MNTHFGLLPLALLFGWLGQAGQPPRALEPGQPLAGEIAGGQPHAYRITLAAGQFMRVVVEQRGVDVELELTDPGGVKAAEANFTRVGGRESLSWEAAGGGVYVLTLRAVGAAVGGAY